ncbi:TRAP transporter substrate-binding protein [Geminicoccaceae bacterium 1502E]|nr:TRAP transporter substrate-binding protein [Geminicoccaceae bacterium 1502E]
MIKTLTRHLAAAAVAAVAASPALAATTMNLGWATPLESTNGLFASKFAELADKYTDGEVVVKLRPSGQIAGEDEAFKALQLGTVGGYLVTSNNISPHFGLMDVFVLPFIFRDTEHAFAVLDGEVGDSIKDRLYKDTGVHLLSFNNVEHRDLYNTVRPIETFEDFGGLKYRVPKNEVMIETFRAFGAEPVPLAWSETPTALQTGTIDGGDNGTNVILEMKFYEFADHLAILEHFSSFTPLLVSDNFMSRLSEEDQAAIRRAANEAQDYQREIMAVRTAEIRKELAERGMKVTYPEKEKFIAAAEQVQDLFAEKKGEAFRGLLEQIRATGR